MGMWKVAERFAEISLLILFLTFMVQSCANSVAIYYEDWETGFSECEEVK